jgi:tetratricopeptide (TPR) repeat protein
MALKIFYCYAHEDQALRDELEKHLSPLKRLGRIIDWCDQKIKPGTNWKQEIDTHLNDADVILLLVRPSFIVSDYCYSIEMQRAITRHQAEDVYVLLIILRPVHWEETILGKLQALPTGAKPITKWRRRDDAYWDIVNGVTKIVKPLLAQQCRDKGHEHAIAHNHEKALEAYNQAIQLEPDDADTYYCEGNVLFSLKYFDEARVDYEQAIHYAPQEAVYYEAKAIALFHLGQHAKALTTVDIALQLVPEYINAYCSKRDMLLRLGRNEDAAKLSIKIEQLEKNWRVRLSVNCLTWGLLVDA